MFEGTRFGSMQLPEIQTSAWGTTVQIKEQIVHISDMEAYKAYVRSIILGEQTSFQLAGGDCTVQALGLTARCTYGMEVPIRCMQGLQAELVSAARRDEE